VNAPLAGEVPLKVSVDKCGAHEAGCSMATLADMTKDKVAPVGDGRW